MTKTLLLAGAAINLLIGALLLISPQIFSISGRVILWTVAILVIGIGLVELGYRTQSSREDS